MRRNVLFNVIAPLALGACSASTAPGRDAVTLWIANYQGSLSGYTATQVMSSTGAPAAVVIARSDTNPRLAFDARGNLWISNPVHNTVAEYTADQLTVSNQQTPNVTLTADAAGSLNGPVWLAFDAGGDLWIANVAGSIVEYTARQLGSSGSPTPVVTLAGDFGSIQVPEGLTFDGNGNLWVTGSFSDALIEFAASQLASSGSPIPAVTLSDTNASSVLGTVTLAFDAAGDMWVANPNAGRVVKFDKSQIAVTGIPAPAVTLTSVTYPRSPAFDGHGNLWVLSSGTSTVVEYAASQLVTSGFQTPSVTVSSASISSPIAIVFAR